MGAPDDHDETFGVHEQQEPQPSFDEATLERIVHLQKLARGYVGAAKRAVGHARRYRAEEGRAGGTRERACLDQAAEWRREARDLRREAVREREVARQAAVRVGPRPGIVRARPEDAAMDDVARRASGKRGA